MTLHPPYKEKNRRMDRIDKLTPMETVKAMCKNCLGITYFNAEAIRDCEGDHIQCSFFPYRLGKRPPVKVFRKYCLNDCMNGYQDYVSGCTTKDCANHPYRFGKNPALNGRVNTRGIEALRKWRESTHVAIKREKYAAFPH
jgi:hypothetical protein